MQFATSYWSNSISTMVSSSPYLSCTSDMKDDPYIQAKTGRNILFGIQSELSE